MKRSIFSALLSLLLLQAIAQPGTPGHMRTDIPCLQVNGKAIDKYTQAAIDGATVTLYKENEQMEWTQVSSVVYHQHNFSSQLNVNQYYTIEISKEGYVTRSIGISTMLADSLNWTELFHFDFDVEMFKLEKGMDEYYLDFPVALVSYDPKEDEFNNHYKYTEHIKTKISGSRGTGKDQQPAGKPSHPGN